MALKGRLRRLENNLQGHVRTIELIDGSTYRFDSDMIIEQMHGYFAASLRAVHAGEERPAVPEVIRAIAKARDRSKAYRTAFPGGAPFMILNEEALVDHGEIVPRRISPSEKL